MYLVLIYGPRLCLDDLLIAVPDEVVMLLFCLQNSTSCVAVVCAVVEPCVDPSLISNTNVTSPIQDISTHVDTKVSSASMGGRQRLKIEATCGSLHGNRSEVVLLLRRTSLIQVNMSLHPVLYGEH